MPLDPLTLGLIMGGIGAAKGEFIDKPKEKQDRLTRAAEIRYSPWTKIQQLTNVREADPFGSALQFGLAGATFGQGLNQREADNMFRQQLLFNSALQNSPSALLPAQYIPQSAWMKA